MAYESLISGWNDGKDFYDARGKYMLQRVEDSFNERKLSSKAGTSLSERTGRVDGDTLRDDKPKFGEAVSLLSDSSKVTDAMIAAMDALAKTEKKAGFFGKQPGETAGLTGLRTVLGRADGTSPNSKTNEYGFQTYDYSLSKDEIAKLKSSTSSSLLDTFFKVDTSKY